MTTTPRQPNPPLLQDRYQITAKLGDTRLASVYRGLDMRLNRPILVHVLRADLQSNDTLRERFISEANDQAKRTHPALLDVFDQGQVGLRPYVITEDASGKPLAEALPLTLPEGMRIWRKIVGAVATALATQTAVPPLASRAILLSDTGIPMLLEPWWLTPDELRDEQRAYWAPERRQGAPPNEAALVYALGVLGYELLSGQRPQGDDASIYEQINGFAPSIEATLRMALAAQTERRIADVRALARDLAAVDSQAEAPTKSLVKPMPALRDSVREVRKSITQRRQTSEMRNPDEAPSAQAVIPAREAPRPVMPPPLRQPPPPRREPAPEARSEKPARQEPALTRDDVRKEMRRELRRENMRLGCLRSSRRLVTMLILLAVLAFGLYFGLSSARAWFTEGQAKTWACGWLPEFACGLLPGEMAAQPVDYLTISPANVRTVPVLDQTNANVIAQLPQGTRVTAPDPDDLVDSGGIQWIAVETEYENRTIKGWIARSLLEEAP